MKLDHLLLEDRADFIAQSMNQQLVARYQQDTSQQADPREVVNKLMHADPTRGSKYLNWLTKMYIAGQFGMKDATRIKHELAEFERTHSKLEVKDINQYQSMDQLFQAVAPHHNDDSTGTNNSNRERMFAESDIIYKDKDFSILSPRTENAAKYFGRGSAWSTAADEDNKFAEHHEASPVYILVDSRGKKYQMWFPSAETSREGPHIKDAQNNDYSFKRLMNEYPKLEGALKEKTTFKEWADPKNMHAILWYSRKVIGGRWQEAEPTIAKDPEMALKYAMSVIGGRFQEAEASIISKPEVAIKYSEKVLKQRWPAAEKTIIRTPHLALQYAVKVIKGRWPEAEKTIKEHPVDAKAYQEQILKGAEWPDEIDTSRHEGGKPKEKKKDD